jgi:transcriptional regulator of acetoin/glycerol metabolism
LEELENCIESMVAMAERSFLTVEDLPDDLKKSTGLLAGDNISLLERQTKQAIQQALAKTNGKIAPAARMLGIGRTTLYRKIEELGIKT